MRSPSPRKSAGPGGAGQTRQQRRAAARAKTARPLPRFWAIGLVAVVALGATTWLVGVRLASGSVTRDGAPSWSPDGHQIVFYSERGGQPADLYVMNADGSHVRQLTKTPSAEGYPSWSPDGRQIVFESDGPDGNFDVYVMNTDGSARARLTTDPHRDVAPTWSPDGHKIAFMSDRNGTDFDIFQMNADGSGVESITHGGSNWFPQYSPDGARLAYHVGRDVHVLDLATRTDRRLTTDPDNGMYPSWSPDGRQLAFMSWRNGKTEIFTMHADGSDQQLLVSMPHGSAIDPRWSPDGTRIVFVNAAELMPDAQTTETLERAIYAIDLATRRISRLSR